MISRSKSKGGVGLIDDCDGKSTNWQQYSESESESEFQIHWKRGKVRIKPSWICQLLALESSVGASFLIFFCILFHILVNFSFKYFSQTTAAKWHLWKKSSEEVDCYCCYVDRPCIFFCILFHILVNFSSSNFAIFSHATAASWHL